MVSRGINRYTYEVESEEGGFLILSQIWYPGWRLTNGDREVKLHRTNHALIGAFLPAGRHELQLEMTSPPLQLGLAGALGGLVILVVLLSGRGTSESRPG